MTYFEFFSKYSDMFYYLTFLLGVTNISYNFFEHLSFSHKYDSSQLSKLEGRIHTRLNDIDNKIDMLLCEISHAVSESESNSDSDNNESVIEDEDEDEDNNSDEKSDYEIEEDSIENEDTDTNDNEDNNSDSHDNDELETIEELEASKEPEENVCVDQNDINDYYKDKFIKDKQSNSLSLSGIFRGWY
jgi:hypothetical protein